MPIFRINDKNILFIHIPKTGGTSIESYLAAYAEPALHNRGTKLLRTYRDAMLAPALAMQHFHADLLTAMFPQGFFDYAFMVVRHPLRRLVSEYGHSRQLGRIDSRLPFAAWSSIMFRLADMCGNFSTTHFRPQHQFRCFDAEVFRFEDGMKAILDTVAGRIGLPAPATIPHTKSSPVIAPRIAAPLRARIEKRYALDYSVFGYAPDMPAPAANPGSPPPAPVPLS